jgi:succinate dehydrogenase / fumarate reductase cytochrome b subunit
MPDMSNQPSAKKILFWFDPRYRQIGSWGFILNRITALGLSLYLFMHLFMLSKLAQGPEAYDAFINQAKTPIFMAGELLVIAAGLIHGLNGIRIALNSIGIGTRNQRAMFIALMGIALLGTAYFFYRMFFGE